MMEDQQNKILFLLMNSKVYYGIFIALVVLFLVKLRINKRKEVNLLKRKNVNENSQGNQQLKDKNEKEDDDIESSIEIIKRKNEEKKKRKSAYYHLIAKGFSFFHNINPISVYMMVHQDTSKINPISSSSSSSSSPEHQQDNVDYTPSSSSKKLNRNDLENQNSSLHHILKSESNDSVSYSHHTKVHHRKVKHEQNDSQSSVISSKFNEFDKSIQSDNLNIHHSTKDKYEPNQTNNHVPENHNKKVENSSLKKDSICSKDDNHHQNDCSTSNIHNLNINQNPGQNSINKSSFIKITDVTSQTNTTISQATPSTKTDSTTNTSDNNQNIENTNTSLFPTSSQNMNNKYSYFFDSLNSLKETVFGKPKNREINISQSDSQPSISSLNSNTYPSSTSIFSSNSYIVPNANRPRNSFMDIIRQGFEFFREDYSNQYIEELLDIYRDENITRALKAKKGGATDDELKFLKTVLYIPNDDDNDTKPPVKEMPNLPNINESDVDTITKANYEQDSSPISIADDNNDQLPSPATSNSSSTTKGKEKCKGKEVANDDNMDEHDPPIENSVSYRNGPSSSTNIQLPMSPVSENNDEIMYSKSLNEKTSLSSINENRNSPSSLKSKDKTSSSEKENESLTKESNECNHSNKIIYNEKKCSICFDDFQIYEKVIMLECSHIFHRHCIASWLKIKKDCPICRKDVIFNHDSKPNEIDKKRKPRSRISSTTSYTIIHIIHYKKQYSK
ncbi:hypothetical protein BCR36DRAFT_411314 [Piromyces finnis]|uniref:RING-type domain-containing protein n=1 Tax=Piromyces finnis TaxID=1754191 RepID=A0A1Y1VDY2_9FUNG|nr:hypothetical protein BCR36DRAFT_411314 [Piromyces finnis]|eukprot:ORX52953.1 hypothetical protein BCR36DRAFT_411314 [Piromyces finnis]